MSVVGSPFKRLLLCGIIVLVLVVWNSGSVVDMELMLGEELTIVLEISPISEVLLVLPNVISDVLVPVVLA